MQLYWQAHNQKEFAAMPEAETEIPYRSRTGEVIGETRKTFKDIFSLTNEQFTRLSITALFVALIVGFGWVIVRGDHESVDRTAFLTRYFESERERDRQFSLTEREKDRASLQTITVAITTLSLEMKENAKVQAAMTAELGEWRRAFTNNLRKPMTGDNSPDYQ